MKILLVEDDPACRTVTASLLEYLGHWVDAVASGEHALARFDQNLHQLVITDFVMPGISGRDVAVEIKRRSPTTPVVMYTGTAVASPNWVDTLITKPASIRDFQETLSRLGEACSANHLHVSRNV